MSIQNKKAWHNYEILDRFVAGLALEGGEIKSIRANKVSLQGAYVSLRDGEAYLKNMHLSPEVQGAGSVIPLRDRKLLLKQRELDKLQKKLDQEGLTIVPLKLFFLRGWVKVEIALAKGKKKYDKRRTLKERDVQRKLERKVR